MNCPYCGAEVADGQAFCPVCGGSFNAPPEWDDVRRAKPRKQVNKKRALVCAADPFRRRVFRSRGKNDRDPAVGLSALLLPGS